PAMRVRHGDGKNCSGEEWKGLKIVSKCSFSPSGNAGERRNGVFPRAGSPPIASLPALQVRHDDDVRDPEDYARGEQDEFDAHAGQYTLRRVDVCCGSLAAVTPHADGVRFPSESRHERSAAGREKPVLRASTGPAERSAKVSSPPGGPTIRAPPQSQRHEERPS